MATKYIKARMPGRELIHLVAAEGLTIDERFDGEEFVRGRAMSLCGKRSDAWLVGTGRGETCERCAKRR